MAIVNEQVQATEAQPKVKAKGKGQDLAVHQQTSQSTQLSVKASAASGSSLAVAETQAFVVGYAETSKQLAAVVEDELAKIREGRQAAISAVPVEVPQDSDFLGAFTSGLQSLIASIG